MVEISGGKSRKYLKLMAEYCYKPLWDENGAVNLESIALCSDTKQRLLAWAAIYHNSLNWQDPAAPSSWSHEQLQNFEDEGRLLWEQLRRELAHDYEVSYFSEKYHREFRHPDELLKLEGDSHSM